MSTEIFTLVIFCLTIIALVVIGTPGGGDSGKTANKALDVIKSIFRNP